MGAMFTVSMFDVRRGREGIVYLLKSSWVKKRNERVGLDFYEKTRGENSKNHPKDSVI